MEGEKEQMFLMSLYSDISMKLQLFTIILHHTIFVRSLFKSFGFFLFIYSGTGHGCWGVHRHPHRQAAPGGGVPRAGDGPEPGGRGEGQEAQGAVSGRQARAGAGGGGSNETRVLGTVSNLRSAP